MQRTLVTLGCVLALAGGSALAQQHSQHNSNSSESSGGSFTEKAKEAAHAIGEKAKEATEKMKDKTASATKGGSSDSPQARQMQEKADANYKSAKAKCDSIEGRAEKNLCEKQAAAAHAADEVTIARAELKAQGGSSSDTKAMGAGKAKK